MAQGIGSMAEAARMAQMGARQAVGYIVLRQELVQVRILHTKKNCLQLNSLSCHTAAETAATIV